jgi:hypothetical protein
VAKTANEYAAYPGDWVYSSWSNSDLKAWADERGIPVPQPGKRDELIALVRRNSRAASQNLASWSSAAAATAASATQAVADAVFDTWSDSQLKKWADEQGIKVPQGSKRNEMVALCRRQNAQLSASASKYSASAASAYGAATSQAGNQYAQATQDASATYQGIQDTVNEYLQWAKLQLGIAGDNVDIAKKNAHLSALSASKSASSVASSASKKASKAYDEL